MEATLAPRVRTLNHGRTTGIASWVVRIACAHCAGDAVVRINGRPTPDGVVVQSSTLIDVLDEHSPELRQCIEHLARIELEEWLARA